MGSNDAMGWHQLKSLHHSSLGQIRVAKGFAIALGPLPNFDGSTDPYAAAERHVEVHLRTHLPSCGHKWQCTMVYNSGLVSKAQNAMSGLT